MATPTVVPLSGAMPSSSIGGPFGKCFFGGAGVADGDGDALAPTDGDGESAAPGEEPDPAQPATASRRPVRTSEHGRRRLRKRFTG